MTGVPLRFEHGAMHLDVCRICHVVWFDPAEFEQIADSPGDGDTTRPELPLEVRRELAMLELDRIADRSEDPAVPDELWKVVAAMLGMPIEQDGTALNRFPIVTWSLVAIMALATALAFFVPDVYRQYGWIPEEPLRLGGLTSLSSFFLHGSLLHFLGNAYFLVVFGDNIEIWLGRGRYVLLIALAALFGEFGHAMLAPDLGTPVVGASAGISGIIAAYAVRFPRARLGLFIWYYWMLGHARWLWLPAYGFFGMWAFFQVLLAWRQVAGTTSVSAGAHLGGAAVGLIFAWLVKD